MNNAQFTDGDSITLSANAADSDGAVRDVEFMVNGASVAVVDQAPYQFVWKNVAVGQYTITAVVTDNEGAVTQDKVKIAVNPADGGVPPVVDLAYPTANTQMKAGDQVVLKANASDTDGAVARVEFYVDNQLVGSDETSPYEMPWTATEGSHTFKVKAIDTDNLEVWSQEVTVAVEGSSGGSGGCAGVPQYKAGTKYNVGDVVQNMNYKYECDIAGWCSSNSAWAYEPNTGAYWQEAWTELGICAIGPVVNFTTPADNATVLAGENVTLAVEATDADGSIAGVEFFAAGQSLGVDTQAPYSANWLASGNGEVSLSAVATDNEGNEGKAGVLVKVSDQPLVASLTSPTSGTTVGLGKAINMAAEATSMSGTVTKVEFLVNGRVVATDTSAPYTAQWIPGSVGSYTISALRQTTRV
ncbi:chitinase [Photobacterium aphoticum]|uniref:Chitinase n=1 Tax=Photobacterium aphoticum TaxID=754436 RepID=A0A090QUY5_9GAMM|nr:chitinase [Photobacterium aphoticum]